MRFDDKNLILSWRPLSGIFDLQARDIDELTRERIADLGREQDALNT